MTKVINLLGGSGLGKSTTAALIFGKMKNQGHSVELVREFVKEWAWAGKKVGPFGQPIIYGQQLERESLLYGKVDYVVTDSPLVLCAVYQQFYAGHDALKYQVFHDLKCAEDMGVQHYNFVLKRNKPFDPRGRYETEELALKVDKAVIGFFHYHKVPFIEISADNEYERVDQIIELVTKESK